MLLPILLVTEAGMAPAQDVLGEADLVGKSLPAQPGTGDNGINVLLDHSHQFQFFGSWTLPGMMRDSGYRVVGSQATLDTVLDPEEKSRVRVPDGDRKPFAWWPNPEFNVVITYQGDPNAQEYLPGEVDALKAFVDGGGGLVIIGSGAHGVEALEKWPINTLAKEFDAQFTGEQTEISGLKVPRLQLGEGWQPLLRGGDSEPVCALKTLGAGRVALVSDMALARPEKDAGPDSPHSRQARVKGLDTLLKLVSAGKPPVGGSRELPMEAWGGGAIFPELEVEVGDVTMFYARNQKPELVSVITDDMPGVKDQIEQKWLPSIGTGDRMYLILSAGGGGGWAVNAYRPKEVGIISLDAEGILSVFAHELAHTMYGPPNDKGESAGGLPGVFSEAHAGWFQGKIGALRTGARGGHDPNKLFTFDEDGTSLDLATIDAEDNSKGWTKLWWIWQKLDETYGATWYPRWLWVKSVRWEDDPGRKLTWDEVVEDMSIAVGEDLFAFMKEVGTTLTKDRFPTAAFRGETLDLPVAEIELGEGGDAVLETIGDYRQPLR